MSRVFSLLHQACNGPRIKTALVKDSDGNLIATEANCFERWKEHFSLLLQHGTSPADPTISLAANATAPSVVCSTGPVTPEEVRAALGKLNNRKAPGICAITAEMLKSGGESIVEWLTRIFNEVWGTERLPSDWTRGVILPFWKHLKAAFDTVCHTSLLSILHALVVPPKIVALFKLLYSKAQSCVRINGRDSDWFPISSGIHQGCVAAPDLFNCIIDHLMSRVWERVP
ncbi:gamma-aminobutyric acid receptor subunit alpha-2-like [Tachysurus ichikawai]